MWSILWLVVYTPEVWSISRYAPHPSIAALVKSCNWGTGAKGDLPSYAVRLWPPVQRRENFQWNLHWVEGGGGSPLIGPNCRAGRTVGVTYSHPWVTSFSSDAMRPTSCCHLTAGDALDENIWRALSRLCTQCWAGLAMPLSKSKAMPTKSNCVAGTGCTWEKFTMNPDVQWAWAARMSRLHRLVLSGQWCSSCPGTGG